MVNTIHRVLILFIYLNLSNFSLWLYNDRVIKENDRVCLFYKKKLVKEYNKKKNREKIKKKGSYNIVKIKIK